jgi:hypothetical protein
MISSGFSRGRIRITIYQRGVLRRFLSEPVRRLG